MNADRTDERPAAPGGGAGADAAGPTVIELCGSLRVQIRGESVAEALPGRQGRALFAYLAIKRHRPVNREELLDVLWPETLPEAPEAGLSTILARARRAVGPGVIEGRAELRLELPPDAEVDIERVAAGAEEAERALAAGQPEAALAAAEAALEVAGRPLLPGVEGAWVQACREELAAFEPELLEVLARAALQTGGREHLATAERTARTLAERHPFRESGYALLIEVHARRGNVAEATLTYDRLRVLLRDELGTVPSAALSAMHEGLVVHGRIASAELDAGARSGAQPAPTATDHDGAAPVPLPLIGGARASTSFVGRDDHLTHLRSPWLDAATGQRRLALLVGEAGVGKTRLAAQFAAEVHAAGGTVLYGRCDEEPLLSYQPFIQALRHYLRHGDWRADAGAGRELDELARLIPEARTGDAPQRLAEDPDTERYRLFEAVANLIGRATRRRPLLFVLDDLHWADKPTLLLLRQLLRHEDPARLMVLGIFRDVDVGAGHPLSELVADLRRERRFDRLVIEGLDEEETDALVAARLEATASAAFVHGLRTKTEGNPFFIEEALRALQESDAVQSGEEASEHALDSIGVPESVAEVILRRLVRVCDLTAEALTVGAVIGREFDLATVDALLPTPGDELIEAMEEAMEAGLVVEVPDAVDRFAFSHALARDAIYGRLSRTRRLRRHLAVGEALDQRRERGASLGELAHHFFLAREVGGGARAVRYAVMAGDEAARALAYEESVEHYRRAVEAFANDEEGTEQQRCDILLKLGRVQWRSGDAAARETYFEAAASARERGAAEQLARAALGFGERYWEAMAVDPRKRQLIADALDTLPDEDSVLRARLMARAAENLHFQGEDEYGGRLSLAALEMARRLEERGTLVSALLSRHVALLHIEHLDERLKLIDEVLTLAREHRGIAAEAYQWRLVDLLELGEVQQARRDHTILAALGRDLRQPLLLRLAAGWEGVFAHLDGKVDDAERIAREGYVLARRAEVGNAASDLMAMLFTLRLQQGRVAELLPSMKPLVDIREASPTWRAALALARLEGGEQDAGREDFDAMAEDDFAAVPHDWFWFMTMALLAESCTRLGDAQRAAQLYEMLAPFADRYVQVVYMLSWGSVQRHLGQLAAAMDRLDDAEEHFEAALQANARIGSVLMNAETQTAFGETLLRRGRTGDRARAAQLGALALEVALPRDLGRLADRARALTG